MIPDLDPTRDLSFTRPLAAPRRLIWECWTRPEHIPQFFIPAPNRVTAVAIELRIGGRFDTTFDVAGQRIDNRGVYLEIVPQEKLVFTDSYTEGWVPAPEPFLTAILLFADAPDGGTLYTAIARHRSAEACQQHAAMGFFEGWGIVADQLEAYAKTLRT
ncbi:uncharacterized protein YndB with AHSA1/START domain [Rhodobacter viridis]|uniref:Uncharacterized protein YndB with AHSA1/START domain n=1 Tax=Rhodobacter viridis TaxID=1054202 RepID=A0A318TWM6_9RHOB|nr:SRPBCC family protein [Rhodobacter viridis]PYF08167.1 uncharacterized protein YndB with AHSA1/START domain [Rhodobacter viridis]